MSGPCAAACGLTCASCAKKSGGYFGSGESTGSVGVVTINLPRIAYLATDEKDFYRRLDHMMDVSARSLKIKRTIVSRLLEEGLYPYTKHYLGSFDNHFSTIGLVGMNEACLNAKWIGVDLSKPRASALPRTCSTTCASASPTIRSSTGICTI